MNNPIETAKEEVNLKRYNLKNVIIAVTKSHLESCPDLLQDSLNEINAKVQASGRLRKSLTYLKTKWSENNGGLQSKTTLLWNPKLFPIYQKQEKLTDSEMASVMLNIATESRLSLVTSFDVDIRDPEGVMDLLGK